MPDDVAMNGNPHSQVETNTTEAPPRFGCRPSSVFLSVAPRRHNSGPILPDDTQLDRFTIQEHLGTGSLGHVYLAIDNVRGERVAIKVANIDMSDSDAIVAQLNREKSLYDRILDHRHVIKVHDIYPVRRGGAGLLILAMEHAEGGTLRDWLQAHRHDWTRRLEYGPTCFSQLCVGAKAIHEAGVVHADLKPENCLLIDGIWKISDFSAAAAHENSLLHPDSVWGAGATSRHAGTPTYMSPEQTAAVFGRVADPRSDIFSLGMMLHEILHPDGSLPSHDIGGSLHELETQLRRQMPSQNVEVLMCVLARCLQRDPSARYSSATELLRGLAGEPEQSETVTDQELDDGVSRMWAEACRCVEDGQLEQAQTACQRLLDHEPGHTQATAMIADIDKRDHQARQIYAVIEQDLDRRGLDELSLLLREAVSTYPNHPAGMAVQIRMQVKAGQYRQAMQEGLDAIRRADWPSAQSSFQRAISQNPGAVSAERALRFVMGVQEYVQESRRRIDQVAEAGNRERAMALARGLDEYVARAARMGLPAREGIER